MSKSYTGLAATIGAHRQVDHAGVETIVALTTTGGTVTAPATTASFLVNGAVIALPVAGITTHAITDDVPNYVVISYNGGSPTFDVITDETLIDSALILPYGEVFKRAGSSSVHTQLSPLRAHGELEMSHRRLIEADRYAHDTSVLLNFSVDTGLNIHLDGGEVWTGTYEYLLSAITVDTRLFSCLYYGGVWNYSSGKGMASSPLVFTQDVNTIVRAAGGFVAGGVVNGTKFKTNSAINPGPFTVQSFNDTTITTVEALVNETASKSITFWPQLDNLHYNDIAAGDGIGTLGGGAFGIVYIWRGVENEDHMYFMLATTSYANLIDARAAVTPTSLPPLATSHAILVGRIIVEQGHTTAVVEYLN